MDNHFISTSFAQKHRLPAHGPRLLANGNVLFRIWAPSVQNLELELNEDRVAMKPMGDGWYEHESATARAGDLYTYVVDGQKLPDYASRGQPQGVDGPSQLVFVQKKGRPKPVGKPWHETINYEFHPGTISPEGTFTGLIDLLPRLVELGITNIQMAPIAAFYGERGWGYDGVQHFAPHRAYGTTAELAAMIDAVHKAGLTITLDVVYNHFGPMGNNVPTYAEQFFSKDIKTPWGDGIDFDSPSNQPVRDYFLDNAHYWINELGFDGLRLDATHQIQSKGHKFHKELAQSLRRSITPDRYISLIVENEEHPADLFARDKNGKAIYFDAETHDDFHHGVHVSGTGETDGYYGEYAHNPVASIGKTLTANYGAKGHQLNISTASRVVSTQTHDQKGNTPKGINPVYEDPRHLFAAQAIMMLSPAVPMLFQGDEFMASACYPFFCDYDQEMAERVRNGRLKEFGEKFKGFTADQMVDPNSMEAFQSAKLDWDERMQGVHAERFAAFKTLTGLRKQHVIPLLARHPGWQKANYRLVDKKLLQMHWHFSGQETLQITWNSADCALRAPRRVVGEQIFGDAVPTSTLIGPKSLHVCIA